MKAQDIASTENAFLCDGIDGNGTQHNLKKTEFFNTKVGEVLSCLRCTPKTGSDYYYTEKTEKKRIVLHYTTGYLKGDIATLTSPDTHVSVSFVIARDGNIYELFDSHYWSYHLGHGAIGGNKLGSMASIGIELSNIGSLRLSGNSLNNTYGNTYCDISEKGYYCKTKSYRGETFFATFTQKQYESLAKLISYLGSKHNIPMTFLDSSIRYEANDETASHNGITSHVNFRPTDKLDIGPGFEWDKLISLL